MGEIVPIRQLSELAKARIPKRFWSSSFANFEAHTESQRAARDAVHWWLSERSNGPMLALIGKQGTGKSHLLYAAAHSIVDKGGVWIRRWYSFADELRYGTAFQAEGGSRTREPAEVRADWWSAPIVMLDEVRPTSGTNFDDHELARYACHAYDEERAVLITTNVNPLSEVIGAAAASRFVQIVVDGPDMRQVA